MAAIRTIKDSQETPDKETVTRPQQGKKSRKMGIYAAIVALVVFFAGFGFGFLTGKHTTSSSGRPSMQQMRQGGPGGSVPSQRNDDSSDSSSNDSDSSTQTQEN